MGRGAISFFFPAGAVLLAAALLLHFGFLPLSAPAVRVYALGVLAIGVALAWRQHAGRILIALAMLTAAAIGPLLPADNLRPAAVAAAALILPLNFTALAFTPERGRRSAWIPFWLALLFAEFVASALFVQAQPAAVLRLLPLGVVGFALGFAALMTRWLMESRAAESGLLWSLAAALLAIRAGGSGLAGQAYFMTAGLVLVAALIESSYFLAYHDELTGLGSRRGFNHALGGLEPPYTIAAVDVDHFKKFNDTFGHDVGDQVLRMVASRLSRAAGGRAFRVGGEEFTLLFPGMMLKEAWPHLEGLRQAVEEATFTLRGMDRPQRTPEDRRAGRRAEGHIFVTVSIGAAASSVRNPAPADVLAAADKALYRAKDSGRNRIELDLPPRPRAKRSPEVAVQAD